MRPQPSVAAQLFPIALAPVSVIIEPIKMQVGSNLYSNWMSHLVIAIVSSVFEVSPQ